MDEFTKQRVLDFLAGKVEDEISSIWRRGDETYQIVYLALSVAGEQITDETQQKLTDAWKSIENARNELKKVKEIIYNLRKL